MLYVQFLQYINDNTERIKQFVIILSSMVVIAHFKPTKMLK